MSVQYGRCNFDGRPVAAEDLDCARPLLSLYGPDKEGRFLKNNAAILYRAFHTTRESRREVQPYSLPSGPVITWDGILDNREELCQQLDREILPDLTDLEIVGAAYERWATGSFARLIGDWAMSIWDPREKSLVLATDLVGTRHLYYVVGPERVIWSSVLDPLVLFAGRAIVLEQEYIAGWLALFPSTHLTPYREIEAVPAACFVRLTAVSQKTVKYWEFDPHKRISYPTDLEYEEHFRELFEQSVRRRLRSDKPVLAELSGGMDSSSIVCTADTIMARGGVEASRLDTLSYYDDSEPGWNELPYFTKVEERRGRVGCHIDIGRKESAEFEIDGDVFAATPSSGGGNPSPAQRKAAAYMAAQGSGVLLSGAGGDEVTGGVPTPTPELMDLMATAQIGTLASRLKVWAIDKRKPWFQLFFEAVWAFLPPRSAGLPAHLSPPNWLDTTFAKRYRRALTGYQVGCSLLGALPSFSTNLCTLDLLRRQLAASALSSRPPFVKRYPYLDRDLLQFLYSCPRQQLVRPGQRRSLMRRALVGIVPDEILNRRRKAFVVRSPMLAVVRQWDSLAGMNQQMLIAALGIVNADLFGKAVEKARSGQEVRTVPMRRALQTECWLRSLCNQEILTEGCSPCSPGWGSGK